MNISTCPLPVLSLSHVTQPPFLTSLYTALSFLTQLTCLPFLPQLTCLPIPSPGVRGRHNRLIGWCASRVRLSQLIISPFSSLAVGSGPRGLREAHDEGKHGNRRGNTRHAGGDLNKGENKRALNWKKKRKHTVVKTNGQVELLKKINGDWLKHKGQKREQGTIWMNNYACEKTAILEYWRKKVKRRRLKGSVALGKGKAVKASTWINIKF